MKIIFALLFISFTAQANPIDAVVRDALMWENSKAAGSLSDYGVAAMIVGPLGYTALSHEEKRWEKVGAVAGAYVLNFSVNQLVKNKVQRERPDRSDRASFFSGHTSTAFVGAGAICAQASKAGCIAALTIAGAVGYLRIAADKHWGSDVLVGAGVGYAMGKFVPTIFVTF